MINIVGLEPYLYGVVPREMPFDWAAEALKAQAVVARSYALAVRKTGSFDLYDDTRSQVYGGIQAEKPSSNAAVDATAGQILTYGGKVATTFFFSTSGGRTASVVDVWPGSQPTPYLVSVPDPYDSISPHHTWGPFSFSAARLTRAFKVPGRVVDVTTAVNPSARVNSITAVGTRGRIAVSGADVRRILGLRSTWFRVGVLALDKPAAAVTYGAQARITGRARGVARVVLEQRAAGGSWAAAARLTPREGLVNVVVKPTASSEYRLSAGRGLTSGAVAIAVAPRVRLELAEQRTQLRGVVRPVLSGAPVTIQRLAGSAWRSVAGGRVTDDGRFAVRVELAPGSYRARVTPGRGYAPGFSPVLRVLGE